MTKTSALLALLLLFSIVSYTQTILSPVSKNKLEMKLDEGGKLTSISSFGIKKRDAFEVTLTHQA